MFTRLSKISANKFQAMWMLVTLLVVAALVLSGCAGTSQKKMYTIGVANLSASFDSILDGFKSGMEKEGFKEGENVTYLYDGPAANLDALNGILENYKSKQVDLVLAFGTTPAVKAKQALEGTNIPAIFGPVTDPVSSGVVADLQKPGGNVTGIRTGNPSPQCLKWLMTVAPNIKRIYVFNNPKDDSSVQALAALTKTAPLFNVDLVVRDASTVEEIDAGLKALPEDVDAMFIPATALFQAQMDKFIKAANEHKLPLAAPTTDNVRSGALVSFGHDNVPLGKQASRLAVQILQGVKPADLPVETAELFTSINLKTAEIIGRNVSNEVIRQANIVVR
jgi:putative ABC transport system substrate-binding protein